MSGSHLTELSGLTVPTEAIKSWDHTFVVSACGWRWACWGNCEGGAVISQGMGSSYLANCISKPLGTAGISTYGIDGVCHQTANRILLPALAKVSEARGYNISVSIFGEYGTGAWAAKLATCDSADPDSDLLIEFDHPTLHRQAFTKDTRMQNDRTGRPSLAEMLHFAEEPDEIEGVRQMCARTGVDVSDSELGELASARSRARSLQIYAASNLRAGFLTREQYYDKVREIVASFLGHNRRLLGDPRFYALFGEAADEPHGLIDRDTFLSSAGSDDDFGSFRRAG